jgi:hypothetical protein
MSSGSLHDTSVSDLTIVNETALDNGDPILTTKQTDPDNGYSHKLLRRLAAEANTDEIYGKSPSLQLRAYFRCQYTLDDFQE